MKHRYSILAILAVKSSFLSCAGAELLTLPGEVNVDNFGATKFKIPIEITPGTAGVQPELSVFYSSTGPDSFLGKGWTISGLSSIRPVGKNVAQDLEYSPVRYDAASDRLELDGSRLVCVRDEYWSLNSEYRTEIESFSRITPLDSLSDGSISGFKVEYKNGMIGFFGVVPNGEVGYDGTADALIKATKAGQQTTVIISWALKVMTDRSGNYIRYSYGQSYVDGRPSSEYYPLRVEYTGRAGMAPFAKIDFEYDPNGRSDANSGWNWRVLFSKTRKLSGIKVHVKKTASSGFSLMNDYHFNYLEVSDGNGGIVNDSTSGVLLLKSIGLTSYDSNSSETVEVPPTIFDYQSTIVPTSHPCVEGNFSEPTAFEPWDASYYSDYALAHRGSGFPSNPTITRTYSEGEPAKALTIRDKPTTQSGDFDGDGKSEILQATLQSGEGGPFVIIDVLEKLIYEYPDGYQLYDYYSRASEIDWGIPQESRETKFPVLELLGLNPEIGKQGVDSTGMLSEDNLTYPMVFVGDFTSDGTDDILHFWPQPEHYAIQIVSYNIETENWELFAYREISPSSGYDALKARIQPMDIDSDGIAEIVLIETEDSMDKLSIKILDTPRSAYQDIVNNKSAIFSESIILHSSIGKIRNTHLSTYQLQDLTQDGFPELLVHEKVDNTHMDFVVFENRGSYSEGDAYKNSSGVYNELFRQTNSGPDDDYRLPGSFKVSDIDNNGTVDLVCRRSSDYLDVYLNNLEASQNGIFDSTWSGYWNSVGSWPGHYGYETGQDWLLFDINRDGKKDLLFVYRWWDWDDFYGVINYGQTTFCYRLGNGDGTFEDRIEIPAPYHGSEYIVGSIFLIQDNQDEPELFIVGEQYSCLYLVNPEFDKHQTEGNSDSDSFQDALAKVENGIGNKTYIEYHPLNTTDHPDGGRIYIKGVEGQSPSFPMADYISNMPVATKVSKQTMSGLELVDGIVVETEKYMDFSYRYAGMRIDLEGRGFLGFHHFTSKDEKTGIINFQQILQEFPATGLLEKRQILYFWEEGGNFWNSGGSGSGMLLLEDIQNEYFSTALAYENGLVQSNLTGSTDGVAYFPVIREAIAKKWTPALTSDFDESGNYIATRDPYQLTITQNWFDLMNPNAPPPMDTGEPLFGKVVFGNLRQVKIINEDGYSTSNLNMHESDSQKWLIGRLKSMIVVHSNSEGNIIRRSSFDYYPDNGLLYTETAEHSNADLYLRKVYQRETWGAVQSVLVSGNSNAEYPIESVSSGVEEWDDFLRFEKKRRNELDQLMETEREPFRGLPTNLLDVNSNSVEIDYDSIGRETMHEDVLGNSIITEYFSENISYAQEMTYSNLSGVEFYPQTAVAKTVVTTPGMPKKTYFYGHGGKLLRELTESLNDDPALGNTSDVEVLYLYDTLGRLVAQSLPVNTDQPQFCYWVTTFYDPLNRTTKIVNPDDTRKEFVFNGRYLSETREFPSSPSKTTVVREDSRGNAIESWNAGSIGPVQIGESPTADPDVRLSYDAVGNLLRREHLSNGQSYLATSFDFGSDGHYLVGMMDENHGAWLYKHDALGRLRWQKDAKDQITTITYDKLDRIDTKVIDGASTKFYYYDDKNLEGSAVGLLRRSVQFSGAVGSSVITQNGYYYDSFARLGIELKDLDGKIFYTHHEYDPLYNRLRYKRHYWRPKTLQADPLVKPYIWQSFGIKYSYNSVGAVTIVEDSLGKTWWNSPEYNALV